MIKKKKKLSQQSRKENRISRREISDLTTIRSDKNQIWDLTSWDSVFLSTLIEWQQSDADARAMPPRRCRRTCDAAASRHAAPPDATTDATQHDAMPTRARCRRVAAAALVMKYYIKNRWENSTLEVSGKIIDRLWWIFVFLPTGRRPLLICLYQFSFSAGASAKSESDFIYHEHAQNVERRRRPSSHARRAGSALPSLHSRRRICLWRARCVVFGARGGVFPSDSVFPLAGVFCAAHEKQKPTPAVRASVAKAGTYRFSVTKTDIAPW
jgi:hypothetical protein